AEDGIRDWSVTGVQRCALPISPAQTRGSADFGFACGEPHGRTALYTYDGVSGTLVEQRRFDAPRAVLAAGNGALAVRGGCAEGEIGRASCRERGESSVWSGAVE